MILGHFAPLQFELTGVADYAVALHRALSVEGTVQWNNPDADAFLYHIGNNELHAGIYERALRQPGVIILHDAVLHHFLLTRLSETEYLEEFQYNYGSWSKDLAESLWKNRAYAGSNSRYFEYPLIRRVIESSKAVIVHNPRAADLVRRHTSAALVEVIPHLFEAPHPLPDETRMGTGVLFGVFGHLREPKRIATVLKAVRQIPGASLLVAGRFISRDYQQALESDLNHPQVISLPFASEREFWSRARSIDVCVNLRVPSVSETSGISVRMMGIGKPVIMSVPGEADDYPAGTCAGVESGVVEYEMLVAIMHWLATSSSDRRAMGRLAQQHIQKHHAPEVVASRVWKVLRSVKG